MRFGKVAGVSLAVAGALLLPGCGSSSADSGLSPDQVRPTLDSLPYHYSLREISFPGTKTAFVGTARAASGARADFAISICDHQQCPDPPVPTVPRIPISQAVIGHGWAFLDNGTAQTPGQTRRQGLAVGQDTFLALCHAAHEQTCY
jgi:hypothetical protein